MKRYLFILLIILNSAFIIAQDEMPFRAAWIATVAGVDWPDPASVGKPEVQQRDMIAILDSLQTLGFNAIIFQVRPTADALYCSDLEPTSHWVTGKQGAAADYDPLQFVLDEAHKRGMQVHAWLNPYRVTQGVMTLKMLAESHIARQHPEWFVCYNKQWYFNPALDDTRHWICGVVADLVRHYDIQGVHMDDYFYPYPVEGQAFPDEYMYTLMPRGFKSLGDWRRNNVNMVIRELHDTIKAIKPEVEFGIAPFGVWRNAKQDSRGSQTQALSNYDQLYADIRLWMEQGWIDYVVPQLYWEIGKKVADYRHLCHWWADNCFQTKLYIGMAPYRLGRKGEAAAWHNGNEIARQMRLNRTIPQIQGEVMYSTRPMLRNPKHVCDTIMSYYAPETYLRFHPLPPVVDSLALDSMALDSMALDSLLRMEQMLETEDSVIYQP